MKALGVLLAVVLALGLGAPAAAVEAVTVCTFQDTRIRESSGLVDLGGLMATVNDSGDDGRVYVVDPQTGETVGETNFSTEVKDVESMAPAGPGQVWVGDTGGNITSREEVEVWRVPVGRGTRSVHTTPFTLRYPSGGYDTESLFADRDGRLYLITKNLAGGVVFRAPARLTSGTNMLRRVAKVPSYATDAALLNDGRHVVVRSYGQAAVYRLPGFRLVGSFALPAQRQGEGISVGRGDRIRLSSEGLHAPLLQMQLPVDVVRAMEQRNPTPMVTPSPPTGLNRGQSPGHSSGTWLAWVAGALLIGGAAVVGTAVRRGR